MMTTGTEKSVAAAVVITIAILLNISFASGCLIKCHNGFCHQNRICLCHKGYMGAACDQREPCYSSPCKNGGTCRRYDNKNGYKCTCRIGFTEPVCERDPCISTPCQNGGTCLKNDGNNGYSCRCKVGFTGHKCESDCEQDKMDILLIDDVSTSISGAHYEKMKDFEVELVSSSDIEPSVVNVALMTFSGMARVIFPLKSYTDNKTAAVQAAKVPHYEGGSTFLGDAVRLAASDVFVESNGDRPDAENVVIIFTDGKSSQVSVIASNIIKLHAEATVFVVPVTTDVDQSTIRLAASPPYQGHIFPISNDLALDKIKERTIYQTCYNL
ncbi:uncharacterized protein [Haliotis asinina]|uniref:uncharacterized protein n=1 Tax=Haliotis asinina TaxID=109174 RepID=UPI0035322C52